MDIYQEIHAKLKNEYADGATYQEMASKYGVSYQYLRELIQGEKPIDRMSLAFFKKLFPNATLNLQGDTVIAKNSGINNGVLGVNHGTVNGGTPTASAEEFRSKAITAMIDLDIPSDALREVLKTLKDLQI